MIYLFVAFNIFYVCQFNIYVQIASVYYFLATTTPRNGRHVISSGFQSETVLLWSFYIKIFNYSGVRFAHLINIKQSIQHAIISNRNKRPFFYSGRNFKRTFFKTPSFLNSVFWNCTHDIVLLKKLIEKNRVLWAQRLSGKYFVKSLTNWILLC